MNPYPYPPQQAQAQMPPQPGPGPGFGTGQGPQYWSPSELIGAGWNRMKNHIGVFIVVSIIFSILALPLPYTPIILMMTHVVDQNSLEFHGLNFGQSVVFLVMSSYFLSGFLRMCIATAKGESPTLGMFFSGRGFLGVLGFQTMLTLPGLVGHVINMVAAAAEVPALFIVSSLWSLLILLPLVFAWIIWGQAPYISVDKGLGPIAAMRMSAEITRGQRANVFVAGLLAGLVMMAGGMACGVGLLVTGPLFYVIMSLLYVRLSGQDPAGMPMNGGASYGGAPYASYPSHPGAAAPPGYGPPPPPGGYGSPY